MKTKNSSPGCPRFIFGGLGFKVALVLTSIASGCNTALADKLELVVGQGNSFPGIEKSETEGKWIGVNYNYCPTLVPSYLSLEGSVAFHSQNAFTNPQSFWFSVSPKLELNAFNNVYILLSAGIGTYTYTAWQGEPLVQFPFRFGLEVKEGDVGISLTQFHTSAGGAEASGRSYLMLGIGYELP